MTLTFLSFDGIGVFYFTLCYENRFVTYDIRVYNNVKTFFLCFFLQKNPYTVLRDYLNQTNNYCTCIPLCSLTFLMPFLFYDNFLHCPWFNFFLGMNFWRSSSCFFFPGEEFVGDWFSPSVFCRFYKGCLILFPFPLDGCWD